MKVLLTKYLKRMDARSQRERMLILLAGIAIILGAFYVAGIAPALAHTKTLNAKIADEKKQIIVADVQKAELEKSLKQPPDVALRDRITVKRRQIADVESHLAGLQRTLVPPERMASVLEQLIGQDRRVRIVGLVNLPPTPLVQKGNQAAPAVGNASATPGIASAPPAQQAARHVFKHGVQVRVEGSYLDVLAYVAQIEKQPWQVYWGRTEMSADYPQVQVELTLYTLSLDKAWLVV